MNKPDDMSGENEERKTENTSLHGLGGKSSKDEIQETNESKSSQPESLNDQTTKKPKDLGSD